MTRNKPAGQKCGHGRHTKLSRRKPSKTERYLCPRQRNHPNPLRIYAHSPKVIQTPRALAAKRYTAPPCRFGSRTTAFWRKECSLRIEAQPQCAGRTGIESKRIEAPRRFIRAEAPCCWHGMRSRTPNVGYLAVTLAEDTCGGTPAAANATGTVIIFSLTAHHPFLGGRGAPLPPCFVRRAAARLSNRVPIMPAARWHVCHQPL